MPLQLRSLIRRNDDTSGAGTLEISLAEVPMPQPATDDEIVVRMEAAPMNPSDLGLLFGGADLSTAKAGGTAERPVITAAVAPAVMAAMGGRLGQSLPVGNEGAGTVVEAGASPAAQALIGRRVAILGGAMYSEYRAVPVAQALPLPERATAAQGASCFVNPLTALGMTQTMRREGHTALVHTAAASNLGQMLNRICHKDGIGLVNIVRKPDQAALLKAQGAQHVVDSSAPDFMAQLTEAISVTGATVAFDAIGGGKQAGQILGAMEAAIQRRPGYVFSRYGSDVHKQVYVYGGLGPGAIEITRAFGMAWGVGGWLLFPFMQKVGAERLQQLRQRVTDELTTTFASHYTRELSMRDVLTVEAIAGYSKQATGAKVLMTMSCDAGLPGSTL